MLALTIRLPSEARAGLLAWALLIFWILATGGSGVPSVPPLVFGISPFAFVYGRLAGRRAPSLPLPPLVGDAARSDGDRRAAVGVDVQAPRRRLEGDHESN